MSDNERTLHQILTSTQTGTIVCQLGNILGIPTYEAFRRFFKSKTYAQFRTPGSLKSMLSDSAIVKE
ncbi:MAG: hypothetical protein K2K97_07445, partial [Muribaculaceae bacterium]|nr:hypothetical protein [Muribaculaceae bacterium]